MALPLRVAVIGAGWAGCAAAVTAAQQGHAVTLYEAATQPGGRARTITLSDGTVLDNGQHIMIGAYRQTLAMMRTVGADPQQLLQRLPLDLRLPDGSGLQMLPASFLPAWDVLRAIAGAHSWSAVARWSLLRTALRWQLNGYRAAPEASVRDVCHGLHVDIMQGLIRPLCISAFNSLPQHSSGAVFLRVVQDALMRVRGGSDALIARVPMGDVFPVPALAWLQQHQATVHCGARITRLQHDASGSWRVDCMQEDLGGRFERVILAVPPWQADRLLAAMPQAQSWAQLAQGLRYMPIATTYAWSQHAGKLPPMQGLQEDASSPAQFVFRHCRPAGQKDLLAFVTSCCTLEREVLEAGIRRQAATQLALPVLDTMHTVIEKRATFVCSPGLQRPPQHILPDLLACGDYVQGPYPATLEGAVLSGQAAALSL